MGPYMLQPGHLVSGVPEVMAALQDRHTISTSPLSSAFGQEAYPVAELDRVLKRTISSWVTSCRPGPSSTGWKATASISPLDQT